MRLILFLAAWLLAAAAPAQDGQRWVGTWASSQQVPEERNALPTADLENATLRQVVRVTIGGSRLRVRLSNVLGALTPTPASSGRGRRRRRSRPA